MAKYQYLVIHCADTYPSFVLSKPILQEWHKGPRDEPDGRVVYLGKFFPNRAALPRDIINGKLVKDIVGRGWDRLGYRELIHREGNIETLTPHNDDGWITNEEMTWGATGFNGNGVHICLEGGKPSNVRIKPAFKGAELILFTPAQLEALTNYLIIETAHHPDIKIAGHYQLNTPKNCPNFNVPDFLNRIGLNKFIYNEYEKV